MGLKHEWLLILYSLLITSSVPKKADLQLVTAVDLDLLKNNKSV